MDKQTDPNQKENPQPNPPPFKIKFLDVFCGLVIFHYFLKIIIYIHNVKHKTNYKALFDNFIDTLPRYQMAIFIIFEAILFCLCFTFLAIRRNNYVKTYQPELYYKMNYDIEFMKERAKKFQRRVLLMFLLGSIILYFI